MRIIVLNKESLVDFVDPVARRLTAYEMCVCVCVCLVCGVCVVCVFVCMCVVCSVCVVCVFVCVCV